MSKSDNKNVEMYEKKVGVLTVKNVISKGTDVRVATSKDKLVSMYTGNKNDDNIEPHMVTFYVDDIDLIRPVGGKYNMVITEYVILFDATVRLLSPKDNNDRSLVILTSDKIAILNLNSKG